MSEKYTILKLTDEELDEIQQSLAIRIFELKFNNRTESETETEEENVKRQKTILKLQKLYYALRFIKR